MAELPHLPRDLEPPQGGLDAGPPESSSWLETLRLLAGAQHEDRLARRHAEQVLAALQAELAALRQDGEREAVRQASALRALQEQMSQAESEHLEQLDEARAMLAACQREALEARHEFARQVRRIEHESAIYLSEIDRLGGELAVRGKDAREGPAGPDEHSRRFTRLRIHPLVEARLSQADNAAASAETSMDAPLFQRTNYQPVFVPSENGEYLVTDFLALHDRNFVRAAYLAILRREPDPHGGQHFLEQVRAGEPKARLLGHLLSSEEGRKHRTQIHGLKQHLRVLRLCELPLIGRFVSAALLLANVNSHLRELRVLENHMIRIAEESQALHETNMSKLRSTSK